MLEFDKHKIPAEFSSPWPIVSPTSIYAPLEKGISYAEFVDYIKQFRVVKGGIAAYQLYSELSPYQSAYLAFNYAQELYQLSKNWKGGIPDNMRVMVNFTVSLLSAPGVNEQIAKSLGSPAGLKEEEALAYLNTAVTCLSLAATIFSSLPTAAEYLKLKEPIISKEMAKDLQKSLKLIKEMLPHMGIDPKAVMSSEGEHVPYIPIIKRSWGVFDNDKPRLDLLRDSYLLAETVYQQLEKNFYIQFRNPLDNFLLEHPITDYSLEEIDKLKKQLADFQVNYDLQTAVVEKYKEDIFNILKGVVDNPKRLEEYRKKFEDAYQERGKKYYQDFQRDLQHMNNWIETYEKEMQAPSKPAPQGRKEVLFQKPHEQSEQSQHEPKPADVSSEKAPADKPRKL